MALNKDSKLVRDFLAANPATREAAGQGSTFLDGLDSRITSNRAGRRAAQQTNRAIGAGAFAGNSPFGGNAGAMASGASGAGGRSLIQQGMGPVSPVGNTAQAALPSASRGLPAAGGGAMVPTGNLPVPTGNLPVPTGNLPVASPPTPMGAAPIQATMGGRAALNPSIPTPGAPINVVPGGSSPIAAGGTASRVMQNPRSTGAALGRATLGPAKPGVTQAMRFGGIKSAASTLGVNVTKQSMMRGAGVAGTGVMVSQFFDGLNAGGENSFLDRSGSGAILGGSLAGGAAVALGIPHVAAAAAGGALLFGGYKAVWGDKKTTSQKMATSIGETKTIITDLGNMYGIDAEQMDDILLQYDASTSMYLQNDDNAGLKNFMAGMGTQLPALMLAARDDMKSGQSEQDRVDSIMATQAQFAPIFEKSLDRAAQASQTAYATSNQAATYLDQRQPQLAALSRQTAAQSQSSAANLQAAYARQMGNAPVMTGQIEEIERQVAQQELMNQQLAGIGQFP